jgi:hypothetical protein
MDLRLTGSPVSLIRRRLIRLAEACRMGGMLTCDAISVLFKCFHLLHISDALCRFPISDGVVPHRSYSRRSSSSSGMNQPRRASAREEELLEKVGQMEERMAQY